MDMEEELDEPQMRGERPIFSGLREEWDNKEFADVQILCKDRELILSHRMVLATMSNMIRRALVSNPIKDEDTVIMIPDVEAEDLSSFLSRGYQGGYDEVQIPSFLDYLGFTDQLISFQMPFAIKSEEAEIDFEAVELPGYQTEDQDPDPDPDQVYQSIGIDEEDDDDLHTTTRVIDESGTLGQEEDEEDYDGSSLPPPPPPPESKQVKLLMEKTVAEREEQILLERKANPVDQSQRKPKPAVSQVWAFFKRSRDKAKAICKECGKKFKNANGATTTLSRHLKSTHPELHDELLEMNAEEEHKLSVIEEANEEEENIEPKPTVLKRSPVWKYFDHNTKTNKATCSECEKEFTCGMATTNLLRHMETKHPKIYEKIKKEMEDRKQKQREEDEERSKNAVISVEMVDTKRNPLWQHFEQESLQRIKCRICKATFRVVGGSTSSAMRHLKLKHPELKEKENIYNEELIWQFFTRRDDDNTAAVCIDCEIPILVKEEDTGYLIDHLKNTHSDSYEKFRELQDQSSKKRIKLFTHSSAKKRAVIWNYFDRTEDKTIHSCKACFNNLSCKKKNSSNLVRHLRVSHEKLYIQFMKDSGYEEEQINEVLDKKNQKRGPKPKFGAADTLHRTCDVCKKVYSSRKGMQVHKLAVHSGARPYVCEECGMSFSRKESYKRHNHNNDRPFLCSVCGKTFARRHIRDIHEKAHYGEKRYGCEYCEKRFTTNQKKTIHERIHTGEKPFVCGECGKKFVQNHQLQTHMRIHTGARPYQCDHCSQMFRHLSTRAKHNCPGKPRMMSSSLPTTTPSRVIEEHVVAQTQHIEVYDDAGVQMAKETIII